MVVEVTQVVDTKEEDTKEEDIQEEDSQEEDLIEAVVKADLADSEEED